MRDQISELIKHYVQEPWMISACQRVLNTDDFYSAPAAHHHHHAYRGGLAVHTYEVLDYATHIAQALPGTNLDVLVPAALFHDFAKAFEYSLTCAEHVGDVIVQDQDYANRIGHIAEGAALFYAACPNRVKALPVVHCILAHHGRREWGSPVEPQTKEAYILHAADMLSSRFGPGKVAL